MRRFLFGVAVVFMACSPSAEEVCKHSVDVFERSGAGQPLDQDQEGPPPKSKEEAHATAMASCQHSMRMYERQNGAARAKRHAECVLKAAKWIEILACEKVE